MRDCWTATEASASLWLTGNAAAWRPANHHAISLIAYLIDKVTELNVRSVRGIKCATLTDEGLHDHFPTSRCCPALIVEAAAQRRVLARDDVQPSRRTGRPRAARAILRAKFPEPVGPGGV
jgi:hypothetical protein